MADYSNSIIPESGQFKGEDIRDTLLGNGAVFTLPSGAVSANYMTNYFSDGAKLNWKSKKKPISYNKPFDLTEPEWKAANYGMTPKSSSSIMPLFDFIDGDLNGWIYNKPIGGPYSPYRSSDFKGYKAKAGDFVKFLRHESSALNTSGGQIAVMCQFNTEQDEMTAADIGNLKNCYFGVALRKGTLMRRITAPSTIDWTGQGGLSAWSVTIPTNGLSIGTWDVMVFLAENPISSVDEQEKANTYYTIPCTSITSVNIVSSYTSITPWAEVSGIRLNYRITITNNSISSVTYTNNNLQIRHSDHAPTYPLSAGELTISLGTIRVEAGETISIEGTVNPPTDWFMSTGQILHFMFNSGQYVYSIIPISPEGGIL